MKKSYKMKETNKWSESAIAKTYEILRDKNLPLISDKIYLKNINRQYAIISLGDVLADNFTLENADTKEKITFQNIEELIEAGWAVD